MRGQVLRLVPAEGFGIVRGEDGEEFFLHANAMSATDFEELAEDSYVDFSVSEDAGDERGELRRAVNVRLAPGQMPAIDNEPLPREKVGPR
jgi:cold shock CspA family protein